MKLQIFVSFGYEQDLPRPLQLLAFFSVYSNYILGWFCIVHFENALATVCMPYCEIRLFLWHTD